jgi:hypothetical protein
MKVTDIKVVDHKRWLRAKQVFTAFVALAFVCAIGGLEGTEPMPAPVLAFYLFPLLGYMVWNITRHYER